MTGIWLGIETTSRLGGVALVSGGEVLSESLLPVGAFHSEKLLPAVASALVSAGIEGKHLEGIGVSRGPGSYTGLRIGTATANGLSAGWGVPLRGVSTLRAMASLLPEGPVLCCVRARAGEVFAGAFASPDPLSHEIIPQGLYTSKDLFDLTLGHMFTATGSGRTELPRGEHLSWASPVLDTPRPSAVAVAAATIAKSLGFQECIEPLYLRGFNERVGIGSV